MNWILFEELVDDSVWRVLKNLFCFCVFCIKMLSTGLGILELRKEFGLRNKVVSKRSLVFTGTSESDFLQKDSERKSAVSYDLLSFL